MRSNQVQYRSTALGLGNALEKGIISGETAIVVVFLAIQIYKDHICIPMT